MHRNDLRFRRRPRALRSAPSEEHGPPFLLTYREINDSITGTDAVCLLASIWFLNHSEKALKMCLLAA